MKLIKKKIYKCKVNKVTPECELECDTSGQSLRVTNKDLHLSTNTNSETLLIINMTKLDDKVVYDNNYGSKVQEKTFDRKLSGGAIAGIVIACAAVLIAAILFALFFNTPVKPPMENANNITGAQFNSFDKI